MDWAAFVKQYGEEAQDIMDRLRGQGRVGRFSIPQWRRNRDAQRWDLVMGDDVLASVWQSALTLRWHYWVDGDPVLIGTERSYNECVATVDAMKPWDRPVAV